MAEPNLNLETIVPSYIYRYKELQISHYVGNKGQGLPKHEHTFCHLTMVTAGKYCIRKENFYKEYDAGSEPVNLKENEWHEIEILEDNTTFININ
jgi:quercetin dioxygenase-like cupin family protein